VLDDLNRQLKPHGLWFPVDISTSSRATIGGMAGNNSCGGRSMRYGTMRDNVISIEALLADGTLAHFGRIGGNLKDVPTPLRPLAKDLLAIGAREADEIAARFPKVQRRVGGYNLDALVPGKNDINLAHVLIGGEGTLAFSTRIELKLSPLLGRRAVGACHFGSFSEAMNSAQHIVRLKPIAVELIDRTMVELARQIPIFQPTLEKFVRETPEAILLVEFGEDDHEVNLRMLQQLKDLMGDLGFGWDKSGAKWGGVVEVLNPDLQAAITEVRTSGLNIMMSMKDEGKPVSFVEDCAVPLEHLADYTTRLTAIFEKHGTRGTWYAHAGSGCLHVRPISICDKRKMSIPCVKSPKRRSRWCANTRARIRRTWRWARALRVQRADVRLAARPCIRGSEGSLRPERALQSWQGRTSAQVRRPQPVPLRPRLPRRAVENAVRLVALSRRGWRHPGCRRDVQQQRRLPQIDRRRHVPELSRDAR
jgi:FAD/FMN-containing dehydrogenase